MTVNENLELFVKTKSLRKEGLDESINEMSFTQYKDKESGKLSGFNKRKLTMAISMICNPLIILLDEPIMGWTLKPEDSCELLYIRSPLVEERIRL